MKIGLDATPLLGRPTGIGRYVQHLLTSLPGVESQDEVLATAFTARGACDLTGVVPAGVQVRARPAPARLLRAAWQRIEWPPVEMLTGRLDVFHGTNFVLPPARAAAGVLTVHDLAFLLHRDTVSSASARLRDIVPRGLRRAGAVCVPSSSVAEAVRDAYQVPADRVHVTPLGVDAGWFDADPLTPGQRQELRLDRPYLLFVGTLEPRKNLGLLLQAFAAAYSGVADGPLLALAGPAGWGAELEVPPAVVDRVVRLGYLSENQLRSTVAGAHALVFPSRYEGFGLPPLEAFATGVPVIASDIPTTRETVGGDKELAVLTAPDDADALAAALLTEWAAAPEEALRERRRAVAAQYTWAATATLTREAYVRATEG